MKKQTRLLIGFVLLIAVFIGVYALTRPDVTQGEKTITVEVVHQDGTVNAFTYHTDAEYLGEVLLSEGLVVGSDGPYGLYITEVDGERAVYEEDNAYWALYQNGESATQGADMTPVADGDTFALVHTAA